MSGKSLLFLGVALLASFLAVVLFVVGAPLIGVLGEVAIAVLYGFLAATS